MTKKTAMMELLSLIPDASEIKNFISENDADEKMLDEWIWERLYKSNDWINKEKEIIIEAFVAGDERGTKDIPFNGEQYYLQTFKTI